MNTEAQELHLYIVNDSTLYRQQGLPIIKNLTAKTASGAYDHDKAVKLYMYLAESGAKKYAKEFASADDWHRMFPVPTRKQVAEKLAKQFEADVAMGSYKEYVPKKYQKPATGRRK